MGVWIEIDAEFFVAQPPSVTPFVGVWIEITGAEQSEENSSVTPFVGVWIEIVDYDISIHLNRSLPSWECGLK